MPAERRALLALGSNLGDRLGNLQDAVRRLAPGFSADAVSALYESEPVGPPGQPPYFNAVVLGRTALEPLTLLRLAKAVEFDLGRRPGGPRWGARPADIDLLWIEGERIDLPELTMPHPRLRERGFVLTPLADVLPALTLDPDGVRVADLAAQVGTEGLRRIVGPDWPSLTYAGQPYPRPSFTAR